MTIAPSDLLADRGARELAELATPDGRPTLDAELLGAVVRGEALDGEWGAEERATAYLALDTLQQACDAANARIDRLTAGRLLDAHEAALLRAYRLDLARYRLYDDAALADEHPVIRRFREADAFLVRVADGRETLGQDPVGSSGSPAVPANAPVRVFTRETLDDFY